MNLGFPFITKFSYRKVCEAPFLDHAAALVPSAGSGTRIMTSGFLRPSGQTQWEAKAQDEGSIFGHVAFLV